MCLLSHVNYHFLAVWMNVSEDTIANLKGFCTIAPVPRAYIRTRACEQLSFFTNRGKAPDCKRTCRSLSSCLRHSIADFAVGTSKEEMF